MPTTASSTKTYLIFGGICVAAVAGGSSLALLTKSKGAGHQVPKDLTVEALREQAGEGGPRSMFGKMRETMRRDDLTDEQRRQIAHNMREVGHEMMEQRVDEYLAAETEEDKNAILDKQIDEFMKMREEWERRREEREKAEGEDRQDQRPNWFASQTQQERKERSESRSADETAKMMMYFTAVRERATQRGIKMPGRGGPRGGGPGRRGP